MGGGREVSSVLLLRKEKSIMSLKSSFFVKKTEEKLKTLGGAMILILQIVPQLRSGGIPGDLALAAAR